MANLQAALTNEHHEIDAGIKAFVASLDHGRMDPQTLVTAFTALRRHIYLEEAFLFPPIRQAGLMMPIMVMVREHGTLWHLMDAITELVENPESADASLEAQCRELLAQLDQHNSKEEPIVYPHAETDLSDEAAAQLANFMKTGTAPEGWVSEGAAS